MRKQKKGSRCSICGATVKARTITYCQPGEGKMALIANVPGEVCVQCGEEYLTPATVYAIQALLETHSPQKTQAVPVYDFTARGSAA